MRWGDARPAEKAGCWGRRAGGCVAAGTDDVAVAARGAVHLTIERPHGNRNGSRGFRAMRAGCVAGGVGLARVAPVNGAPSVVCRSSPGGPKFRIRVASASHPGRIRVVLGHLRGPAPPPTA